VFYDDFSPRYIWTASDTANGVEALGDIEVTTCYQATASCKLSSGQLPRGSNAVVDTRMELIQLDATHHTCVTNTAPVPGAGTSPDHNFWRTTIHDDAHHLKIYHRIARAPISHACGTPTPIFLIRIYVARVSGQPFKIETRSAPYIFTGAIAMNLP
jgi:hypothetical protein